MEELNVSERIINSCFPVNSPTKLIANIFLRVYAYVFRSCQPRMFLKEGEK